MREQKATSDQRLLVSYSEWLTFAEHSLESGFCSIAKKVNFQQSWALLSILHVQMNNEQNS